MLWALSRWQNGARLYGSGNGSGELTQNEFSNTVLQTDTPLVSWCRGRTESVIGFFPISTQNLGLKNMESKHFYITNVLVDFWWFKQFFIYCPSVSKCSARIKKAAAGVLWAQHFLRTLFLKKHAFFLWAEFFFSKNSHCFQHHFILSKGNFFSLIYVLQIPHESAQQ